jgi:hypothetical protein
LLNLHVAAWRNASFGLLDLERFTKLITNIALIANATFCLRKERVEQLCSNMIIPLAFRQCHYVGFAITVANCVQFGIQPAFGATDKAGNIPFLSRLAAVRCALR